MVAYCLGQLVRAWRAARRWFVAPTPHVSADWVEAHRRASYKKVVREGVSWKWPVKK